MYSIDLKLIRIIVYNVWVCRVGNHLVNELSNEINDSFKYLHTSPSTAAQYVDYKKFLDKFSIRVCI